MQYVFTPPEHRQAAVLAVSSFDGVHSRHQQMLAETVAIARRLGVAPIALLPWPPSPDDAAPVGVLTTLGERLALLERFVPAVQPVVLPTDMSQPLAPKSLVERITTGWDVKGIVVDPSCDETLCGIELADAAGLCGVAVTALTREDSQDAPSSAPMGVRIRDAIARGDVAEASRRLAYDYMLSAEVVGGDRRGRLLGFPTANLRVDAGKVIPGNGIYAVRVGLPGEHSATRPAVASVGVRPTFGDGNARLVEVHLLDLSMDLYGVRIETAFVAWLRSEERFATVEALVRQMAADVGQARQRLTHQGDAHP